MGTYQNSEFYDDPKQWMRRKESLGKEILYRPPWPKRHWWVVRFRHMLERIPAESPVLDLGCGNGLLAAFLWHEGRKNPYLGIDFSEGSVEEARRCNKKAGHQNAEFRCGSIFELDIAHELRELGPRAMVTCAETLEHLEDDLELLSHIPARTHVLITVPMFDEEAHVRWFPHQLDVEERYGKLFSSPKVERISAKFRRKGQQCFSISGRFK